MLKMLFGDSLNFNLNLNEQIKSQIKNKIKSFNKTITVQGDKSLSIRWVLFLSIAQKENQKLIIYF